MSGPTHHCGVAGVVSKTPAIDYVHKALNVIQNRGQESCGISYHDGTAVRSVRERGLVNWALSMDNVGDVTANAMIGHVGANVSGCSDLAMAVQPLSVESTYGTVAIAFNGDLTNAAELRKKYLSAGWSFLTDTDAEIMARLLSKQLSQNGGDCVKSIRGMMSEIDGAYTLAVIINDRVFGVRDPYGFRPLCLGEIDDGFMVVSESAAIDAVKGRILRDVRPGEIVEINATGYRSHPMQTEQARAHCVFEWVYFARPDSIIDGQEVYDVRKKIGIVLAKESPVDADIVMPVPDSGRAHALGYSIQSGLQYEEGFMKNRFVDRTFILPDSELREKAVAMKMNPIRSTVRGRDIVLVDDSIVRGTTLKRLISLLRDAGANKIHVRVGCPPVTSPCYYGVDMKTRDQFIANFHGLEEIREILDADSLAYISIGGMIEAVGIDERNLCLACVNGKYPTAVAGERQRYQSTLQADFSKRVG
ncbi:MAG: amidophosphoribosyltransferase [Thermoplasmatales archaeon]|nr:amidophosphoribosyltransferase [Thermoplasmatales archaeon]